MKLAFENLDKQYEKGMTEFLKMHDISLAEDGIKIRIEINNDRKIRIEKSGKNAVFKLDRCYQVFRAVTILKEHIGEETFSVDEVCNFDTLGVMFDGSQASSVMNFKTCKKMLLILAGMGFNMAMLYCEDCYSVEGEPYWGNMRPKFSAEEFREIDDFAYSLGIEMIPCIQTLGHLTEAIKRPPYRKIRDTDSVLMVGEEAVYSLVEKLVAHMSSCFKSRRIHVGLDEALDLGTGWYLRNNGYRPQTELIREHTKMVYKIVEKYGMKPMMWSDMYFRSKSRTLGYYDDDIVITPEDKKAVPENMSLIYWDYYANDVSHYERMIEKHKILSDNIVFAGCSRNVRSFASHHNKTVITTNAALAACKNKGVKEVFATVWGDDHRESTTFAVLPGLQLYAEHMYSQKTTDADVEKRFKFTVGADYKAFTDIARFDCIPEFNGENLDPISPSKICMWQDILLGMCDFDLKGMDFSEHYRNLKCIMKEYRDKYSEYRTIFNFYYHLAKVLENKAYMGIRLKAAYDKNDKKELRRLKDEVLPKLYDDMKNLRIAHRAYFFEEYKPVGWEILDIRYGGAIMRIDTAILRISDYLSGKIDKIEELEEERLSFSGAGEIHGSVNYNEICSASRL